MTKLHFPAGRPELKPRPPSAKFTRHTEQKRHPYPPVQNAGGGKGQKRKGLFP